VRRRHAVDGLAGMRIDRSMDFDALHCFVQHAGDPDRDKRELYADAARWITGPSDGGLHSFATICDVLGIDAGFLRGRSLKQRDASLARRRTAAVTAVARG
jgi:hypothetical protein